MNRRNAMLGKPFSHELESDGSVMAQLEAIGSSSTERIEIESGDGEDDGSSHVKGSEPELGSICDGQVSSDDDLIVVGRVAGVSQALGVLAGPEEGHHRRCAPGVSA